SLVINTYDRRLHLQTTLASLSRQTYRNFEVVVVNGPSGDGTDELLDLYGGAIKRGSCAEQRLGLSRNMGFGLSGGGVVAFVDGGVVADVVWLAKTAAPYDSRDVGGVGGFVFAAPLGRIDPRLCACTGRGDATATGASPASQYLGRGADP